MKSLYPYQQKNVSDVQNALAKHKKIINCIATGGGKTVIFTEITRRAIEKGTTVLIISESLKIFSQIKDEVNSSRYIADGIKKMTVIPTFCYVAMAQTLKLRPQIISQFAALGNKLLIITDEAHISTPAVILKQLPDAYSIGFTATPDYRNGKHLPDCYNSIVIGPQPQELVESGFLSPYYHYERKIVNLSKLKKSSTGDFTEQSQEDAFERKEVFDGLYDDLLKFNFKKGIIFCASIKHCKHVTEKLRSVGFLVSEVHSKNPKSDFELREFTHGNNKLCVSVGSLTKGFDFKSIDLVILHRATTSLPLYLQMCGRGSRTIDGKTHFTVLDYGGNCSRHWLWNFTHPWDELWMPQKRKKGTGAAPVRTCPECGFMMHASTPKCPECGHVFEKKPPTPQETALIEMTNQYNELRGRKMSSLTPLELSVYVKITNRKAFGKRIAQSQGDPFLKDYAKHMGWGFGWWNHTHADAEKNFFDLIIK